MHSSAATTHSTNQHSGQDFYRPARARWQRRARPLVFMAEDDTNLRRMLSDALREAGYDVLSASTGHEMLRLLTAAARNEIDVPDAFVMDVRMPKCSGLEVLSALRLAHWEQPVVMITGFGDPALQEKAAELGASVVLDKPVDSDDLVDMLDVLLRLSHARVMRLQSASNDNDDEPEPDTLRCPPNEVKLPQT